MRGWRPFSGWVFAFVVVERALVFPAWQLAHHLPVDPVEWAPLTALAGLLVISRSYDRSKGTA